MRNSQHFNIKGRLTHFTAHSYFKRGSDINEEEMK